MAKYTRRFTTEYLPELQRVAGVIERTDMGCLSLRQEVAAIAR